MKKRIWIGSAAAVVIVLAVLIAVLSAGRSEATLSQESTQTVTEAIVKASEREYMMRVAEG